MLPELATSAETAAPAAPLAPAAAPRRPLTICAIGYATSPHVAGRVRCFAERGHKVFLITENPSPHGIPGVVELVPGGRPSLQRISALCRRVLRRDPDHIRRALALIGVLRACRPDVVHVHFAYSYYGWLAAVLGCRPLVVSVMGGDVLFDEQGAPSAAGKWLTLNLLDSADYVTSKSDHLTAVLDRLGGFGHKAERIVWGIPVDRFRRTDATALRQQLGLSAERLVIFSPKILQPLYRVHLVVEAMQIVAGHCPQAVLLVSEYAADPAYRAAIAERIEVLGLSDNVRFVGEIAHEAMPAFYSIAEMTVAVPSSDGLPQTLLEGMACQVPNVLGRLPRYEEIVSHRVSAYFVEATPQGIADGLLELLGDPALRAAIAGNAYDIVRREGDLAEQSERVERRYYELAASVKRRAVRFAHVLRVLRAFYARPTVAG